jgi:phytoene synthase
MRLLAHRKPVEHGKPAPVQLAAAYGVCRSISRAAARNFYYSFLALPREKRNAMCAVYAFMRHADDISDTPGGTVAEKREKLAQWLQSLHRVMDGEPTDDPVLLALSDAQRQYDIPLDLLDQLVAGTAMDLADEGANPRTTTIPAVSQGLDPDRGASQRLSLTAEGVAVSAQDPAAVTVRYETFADLYRYCYHVASVVGLVCIRIFGYHDPAAEPLAEQCGVAFQLTNIIRDVREDAAMGRVYLPLEDLQRFGCDPAELAGSSSPAALAPRFHALLEFEAQRARDLYSSAESLLPLVDEDSRPALWVLMTVYRRLLEKIATRGYDVFSEKVRLTRLEKLRLLAKGIWLRLRCHA